MPRGNGTGPSGMGSMTGRQMGRCAGNARPGFANFGRGLGLGRGNFAGYSNMPYGYRNIDTKQSLEAEENFLKEQLEAIKARKAGLEK